MSSVELPSLQWKASHAWQGNTLVKKEKYAAALDRYTEALTFYKEPGAAPEHRRPAGHIKIAPCGVGQEAAHALTGWEALVGGCRCGCLCSAGRSTQERSCGARPSSSGHCIGRERGGMSPHSAAHIGPLNACVPTACCIELGVAPAGHARWRHLRRAALLTNRAFCHKKRGDWGNVEKDSRAALELDGSFLKVPSLPLAAPWLPVPLCHRDDCGCSATCEKKNCWGTPSVGPQLGWQQAVSFIFWVR